MKSVGIIELKSWLGKYLRTMRHRCSDSATVLRIRKPVLGSPAPKHLPLPAPLNLKLDVMDLLDEEREER